MQCPETTIIIQNPDGTIEIATQPHLKKKKLIACYKCKKQLIFDATAKIVKCASCNSMQGVPGYQNPNSQQVVVIECAGCTTILRARGNVSAVQCPFCFTITSLR